MGGVVVRKDVYNYLNIPFTRENAASIISSPGLTQQNINGAFLTPAQWQARRRLHSSDGRYAGYQNLLRMLDMPVPAGKEDFLMGLDMLGTHNPAMLFVAALLNVKPIDLKDISEEQALTVTSFFGNARAIVLQVLILIEIMRVNEIEKLKVPVFERRLLGALNLSDAKLILPVLYEGMALLPVINDSLLHYLASYFEALQDPTLEKVGNWNSFEPGIFLDKSLPPEIKVSASQCLQTQRGSISERMRRVQENLQRIRVK